MLAMTLIQRNFAQDEKKSRKTEHREDIVRRSAQLLHFRSRNGGGQYVFR
jgi:hypothetical protein